MRRPDGGHQLLGHLFLLVALGPRHAMARVVVEQPERHLVQRGLDRADLGEHVDAVAVIANHALHPAHLPLDPAQALLELVLRRGVSARAGSVAMAKCRPYPRGV